PRGWRRISYQAADSDPRMRCAGDTKPSGPRTTRFSTAVRASMRRITFWRWRSRDLPARASTQERGATGRDAMLLWPPARNLKVIDAMILKGKRILIAGMSDRRSIGFSIAQEAQREGAEILLTSFGRMMSITQMTAKKLNPVPEILEMDVSKPDDIANAFKETEKRWDRLDGLVHSVAFAPADAWGGQFLNTRWESVATGRSVRAFSFTEMARGFLPLMRENG